MADFHNPESDRTSWALEDLNLANGAAALAGGISVYLSDWERGADRARIAEQFRAIAQIWSTVWNTWEMSKRPVGLPFRDRIRWAWSRQDTRLQQIRDAYPSYGQQYEGRESQVTQEALLDISQKLGLTFSKEDIATLFGEYVEFVRLHETMQMPLTKPLPAALIVTFLLDIAFDNSFNVKAVWRNFEEAQVRYHHITAYTS